MYHHANNYFVQRPEFSGISEQRDPISEIFNRHMVSEVDQIISIYSVCFYTNKIKIQYNIHRDQGKRIIYNIFFHNN